MPTDIDVSEFVTRMTDRPVIDVRTPAEYLKGHIPGARSFPLFSDDERAEIGTIYKRMGRLQATQAGLDLVGPRLNAMVDSFRNALSPGEVLVHCWRGGMRSQSVAWLMNLTGEFDPVVLRGGYKAYRAFAIDQFGLPRVIRVIGGMTGTGKTHVLTALEAAGAQVIDLEALAAHRGSAFGGIGQSSEPTQQQFENDLALALHGTDPEMPVWIEDESRHIGRRTIPDALWAQMRRAPVFMIERSREERVESLVKDYGDSSRTALIASIRRIERRLGGERAAEAVGAVDTGDLETACNLILDYYDRTYTHGLSKRDPESIKRLYVSGLSHADVARQLQDLVRSQRASGSLRL